MGTAHYHLLTQWPDRYINQSDRRDNGLPYRACPVVYWFSSTEVMIAEELLERYVRGERSFAGITVYAEEYASLLDGINLTGVNLCGSVLDGDWRGVILAEAQMCGVIMTGGDLQDGNLSKANLSGAIITQCDWTGCNFTDAILCGIAFKQTEVCNSDFTRAELRGAFLNETGLGQSDLTEANLLGAEGIDAAILERMGCILHNTRLPSGNLYTTRN